MKRILWALALLLSLSTYAADNLTSPNGKLNVQFTGDATSGKTSAITLHLYLGDKELANVQPSMQLEKNGKSYSLGTVAAAKVDKNGRIIIGKVGRQTEKIEAPFYHTPTFELTYNQVSIPCGQGTLVVRLYDSGLAYRFQSTLGKGTVLVNDEAVNLQFPKEPFAWFSYSTNDKEPMKMAFQNYYTEAMLSQQPKDKLAFLPATFAVDEATATGQCKVTLMESNVEEYPCMYLSSNLSAVFAHYPKSFDNYAWRRQKYVTSEESYIAKTKGTRNFPWRILAVTEKDTDMPQNPLVYALADKNRIGSTNWIKPGKVAWDWWNDWGLEHVDFEAGINTRTYKYYIDFAAKHGLEYVVLDEGWYTSSKGDMLTVIPEIDLPELVRYGREKGVDIVLWTVFNVLDDQLEEACKRYSAMGIKGFKVDFMDRNDQEAVDMTYRIAEKCAQYHLFLDYHGIYPPTGIQRTYPNVINFEACFGMEETKWEPVKKDMPRYDVTMPYMRGMTGPVDFTQGAMRNASKKDWQPMYYHPQSQGTRCHQAAMYVCYDSPFSMLADSPTEYEKEEEYTSIIASVPVTWEESRTLAGVMSQYIVTARKDKEGNWYIAGMNNWDAPRTVTLSLGELPFDIHNIERATLLTDGKNAEKSATDYRIEQEPQQLLRYLNGDQVSISMASGGGFLAIVKCKQ